MRDWRKLPREELSTAETVMLFAETYLRVPEGEHVGTPLKLAPFQERFFYDLFKETTRVGILSIARRNGKTMVVAVVALAYVFGPLSHPNSVVASAAMSRDQAALVFRAMVQMVESSPTLAKMARIIPSAKHIINKYNRSEYYAMSADAKTGHGKSLRVVILDEAGQIRGPSNEYVQMLRTSQGSYENPLFVVISTQAPSDADYLSILIDDAGEDEHTICHVYSADNALDITDPEAWAQANPGMTEGFRSKDDIKRQAMQASRLPSMQAGFENLVLNRRVAQERLWLAPTVWKSCNALPDKKVFREQPTALGLDLSARTDLTAAVLAAQDDEGFIHLLPYVFTPQKGLRDRALRDKSPYDTWVDQGLMIATPGSTISYEYVAGYMRDIISDLGVRLDTIEFDRWRIDVFKNACAIENFAGDVFWNAVGQGYKDMSPRLEAFQNALLEGKIKHGGHPLLNMAASCAIVTKDPAGSIKLDKSKTTSRIDPLVAAVMAAFPIGEGGDDNTSVYSDLSKDLIM